MDYGADGSSTSFTDIILRGTEYGLYSQDAFGVQRPLVRTAFSDEKGLAAGTTDGVLVLIHDGTAASFEKGAAYDTTVNDGSVWWYGEYNDVVVPARTVKLKYDATNIIIDTVGTGFQGQPQKTIVVYHE